MERDRPLQIRFSGSGGQGLILAASILATAFCAEGKQVAQSQSYEPTSRGGLSRADIVAGDNRIDYPLVTALDCLLLMDRVAVSASGALIDSRTRIICDQEKIPESSTLPAHAQRLPLTESARELGNHRVANIIALGAMVTLGGYCTGESLNQALRQKAPPRFLGLNLEAVEMGARLAESIRTPV
jgi:2-oxoglutarate ferredoxin oxidoreductase subunit gamma